MLHGRSHTERIEQVAEEIRGLGREVHCAFADFESIESWDAFVEQAWSWKSGVDVWVNNAGGDVLTGDWKDESLERKLDYLFQVDVKATLMLSRAIGSRMAARESKSSNSVPSGSASIINIGWDQAAQGMEGDSGELFATTKGAIMAMTKSLAQSLAPKVRVNCIAPGWIQTKWGESASSTWDARAKSDALMNRWGQPDDIAAAAVFLASESSSFVSGQVLPVNGGFQYYKD
ncbi:3-oxoacyl-[acyl-carrier-protein] reductase FabG [Mariniblastus fucicola]|uniref:3-oxoacyl-[acyl-carrier-protein] reductase FabG n=1 Tax=Mariniblastus fucicola TaxID=980251 RepID=A0A5B9P9J4_9BACT|nr:3-oxoacyl-[acyl-carrier-protein] reductase FabG [Mariniblastus fucicola]